MSKEKNDKEIESKKSLSLSRPGKLELKKRVESGIVKQSFSHGRSKSVAVEVKKTRTFQRGKAGSMTEVEETSLFKTLEEKEDVQENIVEKKEKEKAIDNTNNLSQQEKETRKRALELAQEQAKNIEEEVKKESSPSQELEEANESLEDVTKTTIEKNKQENGSLLIGDKGKKESHSVESSLKSDKSNNNDSASFNSAREKNINNIEEKGSNEKSTASKNSPHHKTSTQRESIKELESDDSPKKGGGKRGRADLKKQLSLDNGRSFRRRGGKITLQQALDDNERQRSLASVRRAREKIRNESKKPAGGGGESSKKTVREVIVPDTITVQELANRMAVRSADVIKVLMNNEVTTTAMQTIDADTAELVVLEFGHTVRRVSAADVEIGLKKSIEDGKNSQIRPPIVTIMGHVDHGKTSLLDKLRKESVAAKESGGITQHIGAYQVSNTSNQLITFIDTPGHEAFTSMRARGAKVTDIVVLVVAANDGVMPQTIEAIKHAQAANVPIILAINKIDLDSSNPSKIKQELLQHNVIVEDMGGETVSVEISAKEGTNLDLLIESILLQSEILELKANPNMSAEGVIVESKREKGRGIVVSVIVQSGTLKTGDIIVAGAEWGRIRAMIGDKGNKLNSVLPSQPVEILGVNETPVAGDEFVVVENEARAREVCQYRKALAKDKKAAVSGNISMETMLGRLKDGEQIVLPLILKADVSGSLEAITTSLDKLSNNEIKAHILLSGVGGITESDITLASANQAIVLGFSVRPDAPARSLAKQRNVDIRFFEIIYELLDDIKSLLSGLLSPHKKEVFLGYANVKQIFKIGKLGTVAGCEVSEGSVKRDCGVRLLRDNVVIHSGELSNLKHHKQEVKEISEGMECGISVRDYNDLKVGDVLECFSVEEHARSIDDV